MTVKTFIDRPLLSIVISVFIVALGVIALTSLPVEKYPDIAPPAINVWASYPGASAETVQKSVVTPLEDCQACSTREEARFLQVEASRRAYKNSREQMRYAGASCLEVLIAQSTWLDAQLQQATDWLEKQQSYINLYKATCPE